MPRHYISAALLGVALLGLCAAAPKHHKATRLFPNYPTSAESFGLTSNGPCAGVGFHDKNEVRPVLFGFSQKGVAVAPIAYGELREWTGIAACPVPGLQMSVGILFGVHPAEMTAAPYIGVGYRVSLGDGWALSAGMGVIFVRHSHKHVGPPTVYHFGPADPFLNLQLVEKF